MVRRLKLSTQRSGKCDLCKSVATLTHDFNLLDDKNDELTHGTLHTCRDCAAVLSAAFGQDPPPDELVLDTFTFTT